MTLPKFLNKIVTALDMDNFWAAHPSISNQPLCPTAAS